LVAKKLITAIDLGGTNTRIAIFNQQARILDQEIFDTPKDPEILVEKIYEELKSHSDISAIGVAAAGFWDKNCILQQSINLKAYIGYPIWSILAERLKLPIYLKTDVELACIGEAIYGQDNQYTNLLYLNIGTGFSGALYKDCKLFSTDYSPTLRLDFMIQPTKTQYQDKIITNIEFTSIDILSTTIVNLALILSPQIIIIGGGKAEAKWDELVEPAISNSINYLNEVLVYKIKMEKSKLQFPALYGAYKIVQKDYAA
jgi:predicted NBD/HSP70 family sugar kinase